MTGREWMPENADPSLAMAPPTCVTALTPEPVTSGVDTLVMAPSEDHWISNS